jgi:hypothetical protein
MARRKTNTNVVYSGKVGAKMRPKPHRIASRAAPKRIAHSLVGGPLGGEQVRLCSESGTHTLPLAPMRGFPAGRYINSKWTPEGEQA